MKQDAFSYYHPAVNFTFFVFAIGFGVVIQHPAYLIAGCICSIVYYLLLMGSAGWKRILSLIPILLLVTFLNPLINHSGKHSMLLLFGKPYTVEALLYGLALGSIFIITIIWFGCYSQVMTADKFTSLFGTLIPALSLLLVMVLRMIPGFARKAKQIITARAAIGKIATKGDSIRKRTTSGINVLSALTTWALEGSIVTADSMRARGYGCGKRTSFQIYQIRKSDVILLTIMGALVAGVLLWGGTNATYTPYLYADDLTIGFAFYCIMLLLPTILQIKENLTWHILKSRI